MKIETGYLAINKARLYYEIAGECQAVVFIHAGVADSRQWNNEAKSFSQDYRVLRYDLRGYGKSLPVDGEYSHIEDLVSLIHKLEIQKPIIMIGCSMGGTLALDYALTQPSSVRALVMVGSGPSGLQLNVSDHPKEIEAEKAYKSGDLDRVAELEAQIWFDGMQRKAEQVNQEMRKLAIEMNRLALSHDAKNLGKRLPDADRPASARLRDLKIPMLAVVGDNDIPYSLAAADFMVNNVKLSRKVIIKDAAHLPNMDHPEKFQKIVRTFIDEL